MARLEAVEGESLIPKINTPLATTAIHTSMNVDSNPLSLLAVINITAQVDTSKPCCGL